LTRGAAVNVMQFVVLCTYLTFLIVFTEKEAREFRSETEHSWCWSKTIIIVIIVLTVMTPI
jgi:hypothetical protein